MNARGAAEEAGLERHTLRVRLCVLETGNYGDSEEFSGRQALGAEGHGGVLGW